MHISWALDGHGAGSATVTDVDAAARALAGAVRDAYAKDGPAIQAQILTTVVAPLRAAMVTDGRFAVERGESWTKLVGGIMVTLSPAP